MRDDKLANSSTTTVTDKSLPLQDAQVNVATPNPLEGTNSLWSVSSVVLLRRLPSIYVPEPPMPDARPRRKKPEDCLRKRQLSLSIIKLCPSLYMEDIERLNSMVDELKSRGHFKANKSMLIRHALEQLDLDQILRTVNITVALSTPSCNAQSHQEAKR